MKRLAAAAVLALLPGLCLADIRPQPRPDAPVEILSTRGAIATAPQAQAPRRSHRPVPRLTEDEIARRGMAFALSDPRPLIDTKGLVRRSGRPLTRPDDLVLIAAGRPRSSSSGGGICGRPSIKGQSIPPVPGRIRGCGIPDAVRISRVSGLDLVQPARMDCETAIALDNWVRNGVIPEIGSFGGGPVALKVAAGYSCRTRNNQPGARISEHGRGKAIDISAIRLANGSELNVLRDWNRGAEGRLLRALWRKACGPFGTVLGPESDRFHRDHFHFDTASYRSGSYCR